MKNKLILLFLFAFLVRLIALGQSLWLDEATTAKVVQNFTFLEIITKFSPGDFHPPLYYWLIKLWTNVFGYSEVALRMPSVIFSLIAGWFVYLIGRKTKDEKTGAWAAAFFLFNPLIVYYSQEARMYSMATFFLTAAVYLFLQILNIKDQKLNIHIKNQIFFGLFLSLSFLTFYGSIFFISTLFIWLLTQKQYRSWFVSCIVFLVAFVIISSLLYQQLINSKVSTAAVVNWKQVLGPASLKNLILIPVKFATGRIDFHPAWALWTIFVFGLIFKGVFKRYQKSNIKNQNARSLFLFLFGVPIILGFFASFYTPLLQYFRFLYLIPIMCLLLAYNSKITIYRYIIICGFIILSGMYLLNPKFHREDWKELAKDLPAGSKVYMIVSSSDPLTYYRKDLKISDLRFVNKAKEEEVIIIPYTSEIHGIDYRQVLGVKGYMLKKEKSFRELILEQWKK